MSAPARPAARLAVACFVLAASAIACAELSGLTRYRKIECDEAPCEDAGAPDAGARPGDDADLDARADAPVGRTPFACGDRPCVQATEECCALPDAGAPSCVPFGACAFDGVVMSCLESAHCLTGLLCCGFLRVSRTTTVTRIECAPSCANPLCDPGTGCEGSFRCSQPLPGTPSVCY